MSLKNVLHEAVIPFGTGWEVYTRPPAAYEKYGGCLEAELLGDGLQCLFFFFFMEHHFFLKEELTDKLWLHSLGYLADIFSKMN